MKHGKTGIIDAAFERYLDHARANAISLGDVNSFLSWAESPAYDPAADQARLHGLVVGEFFDGAGVAAGVITMNAIEKFVYGGTIARTAQPR